VRPLPSSPLIIVVGIDGSDDAWRAFEWAAAESERRSDTVVVAHAGDLRPYGGVYRYGDFAHELIQMRSLGWPRITRNCRHASNSERPTPRQCWSISAARPIWS
jgi:hypothetical protein